MQLWNLTERHSPQKCHSLLPDQLNAGFSSLSYIASCSRHLLEMQAQHPEEFCYHIRCQGRQANNLHYLWLLKQLGLQHLSCSQTLQGAFVTAQGVSQQRGVGVSKDCTCLAHHVGPGCYVRVWRPALEWTGKIHWTCQKGAA